MEELISVVVPVYNVEKYLDRCVKSILSQTYKNFEVILIDDGATDSSGIICDRWETADTRVRVVHKTNGGLSDARNAGMNVAKGRYICFFDSDDWVEPDILDKAYFVIEESDVVIWGFKKEFVDLNQEVENSSSIIPPACKIQKNGTDCHELLDSNMMALLGYAWNKLYRLDFLREHYFQFIKGVSLVEDILFNSPVLRNANSIRFIPTIGNHYIQRPRETLGSRFYPDYFDLKLKACHAREDILRDYGVDEETIKLFMSSEYFAGLKSSCRMACSSLTKRDSLEYMRQICSSREGKRIIRTYRARGKDNFIKFAFLTKQYWMYQRLYRRGCNG